MMKDMTESHWPIGRVLETYGGSNDVVCVVKLNTNDRAKWLDHLPKRLAWSQSQLIIGSYSLNGEGGCYIICNCNTANIDIVVLFLSEQLSNNIYYTLEKLMFQLVYIYIYIFLSALFLSVRREIGQMHEFSDGQIFHFDDSSKFSQPILLAFGLLLFFPHTSFTKYFEYSWFSYLGIHSDCVLPLWASPAKFQQFQPI